MMLGYILPWVIIGSIFSTILFVVREVLYRRWDTDKRTTAVVRKALIGHWALVRNLVNDHDSHHDHPNWRTWRPTQAWAARSAKALFTGFDRHDGHEEIPAEDIIGPREFRTAAKELADTAKELSKP
jgi:hypothetical protein